MRLIFAKEPFDRIKDEYMKLIESYWFKAPENIDHVPVDMDWDMYKLLADSEILHCYTARNLRDELVGTCFYLVMGALHHKGYIVAECDGLCVNGNYRGLSIGTRLYEYCEGELVKAGVKKVLHRFRLCYNVKPLFPSLGFEAMETVYSKEL